MANEVRLIDANALMKELEQINIYDPIHILRDTRIAVRKAPTVDAVDRKKLIEKLFPMGVPMTREEWNYSINARAVYEAIMKMEGVDDGK